MSHVNKFGTIRVIDQKLFIYAIVQKSCLSQIFRFYRFTSNFLKYEYLNV